MAKRCSWNVTSKKRSFTISLLYWLRIASDATAAGTLMLYYFIQKANTELLRKSSKDDHCFKLKQILWHNLNYKVNIVFFLPQGNNILRWLIAQDFKIIDRLIQHEVRWTHLIAFLASREIMNAFNDTLGRRSLMFASTIRPLAALLSWNGCEITFSLASEKSSRDFTSGLS